MAVVGGPLSFRAMHSEVCKCWNMAEALHFNKKKHKPSSLCADPRAACANRPIQFPLASGNANALVDKNK